MCTCMTYRKERFYFGRNLDLEYSFGEQVAVTPRNYPLHFRNGEKQEHHYAIIGMAAGEKSYPLYAEAANEKGLCMAGLNFPGNARYRAPEAGKTNVASWEMIPYLLGSCASVDEAEIILKKLCVTDEAFAVQMPAAPLHWMLADRERCLVLEAVEEGLKIYENPFGVLTNNPPFPYHRENMRNYLNLTAGSPCNRLSEELELIPYGQGLGALGLPGDASPASRFVKTVFLKYNSVTEKEEGNAAEAELAEITEFFHILEQVGMIRGMVRTSEGRCDITLYSSCICPETGKYYFRTYGDSRIQAVDLWEENPDGSALSFCEPERQQQIFLRRTFR